MRAHQQDAGPIRPSAHFASSSESEGSGEEESLDESVVSSIDSGGGFLDDEAVEASANEEEMEWESEGCESDGEDGSSDSGGFILDEAEDEIEYHAAKKRRMARLERNRRQEEIQLGSSVSLKQSSAEEGEEAGGSESEAEEESGSSESEGEKASSSGSEGEEADSLGSEGLAGNSGSEGGSPGTEEEEAGGELRWKKGMLERARRTFEQRKSSSASLRKLIYSDFPLVEKEAVGSGDEAMGGLFHIAKSRTVSVFHHEDCSCPPTTLTQDWSLAAVASAVKSVFVTGSWGVEDAQALLEDDSEVYGDFEDLVTGQKSKAAEDERGRDWLLNCVPYLVSSQQLNNPMQNFCTTNGLM